MSGQELEVAGAVVSTPAPLAVSPLPSDAEFGLIMRQADIVSRSGIVPASYRTTVGSEGRILQDKRSNVVVATLFGRTFGWDLMTAIRNIHVIEGAATLKPEAMLAMIRARGHRVRIDRGEREVRVYAQRVDNGDEMAATFSFEDAVRAGLCTLDDNGQPFARSKDGKPLPWEQYPIDMCQWRAVSIIARGLFGDVVLGLGYTPEELGAIVEATGEVVDAAPMPAPGESAARADVDQDEPGIATEAQQERRDDSQGNETTPTESPEPATEAAPEPAAQPPVTAEATQEVQGDPTLDEELRLAQVARRRRNVARRGPAVNQARARAWDAVVEAYPEWSEGDRKADQIDELLKVEGSPTPLTATLEQWTQLAELYERAADDRIRARHARG